jgi:hypothetical protein
MKPVPGPRTFVTQRIANNASATTNNTPCLEKKVRAFSEWDNNFAMESVISLWPIVTACVRGSQNMLGGAQTWVKAEQRQVYNTEKTASFMAPAPAQVRRSPERHLGRSPNQTF